MYEEFLQIDLIDALRKGVQSEAGPIWTDDYFVVDGLAETQDVSIQTLTDSYYTGMLDLITGFDCGWRVLGIFSKAEYANEFIDAIKANKTSCDYLVLRRGSYALEGNPLKNELEVRSLKEMYELNRRAFAEGKQRSWELLNLYSNQSEATKGILHYRKALGNKKSVKLAWQRVRELIK